MYVSGIIYTLFNPPCALLRTLVWLVLAGAVQVPELHAVHLPECTGQFVFNAGPEGTLVLPLYHGGGACDG